MHEAGHGGDVVGRRRLVVGAALAHHIGPKRSVGDHGTDVDGELPPIEDIQVLAEGLPAPRQALAEGGAGNVLHAFHQLDQEVVVIGPDGSEAHTAVPHDDGGHAVRARGLEPRIPGRLPVVVGVDVDEAGRDEAPVGVDLSTAGPQTSADLADQMTVDADVDTLAHRRAGPVDECGIADHEVVHLASLVRTGAISLARVRPPRRLRGWSRPRGVRPPRPW